ncbi:MAG: hypothetical protein F6J94_13620 [Moorea sp. SIO1F2]|uniref:hypothetical protein n=1 Tax=unclassified Moorena TaxID=2683338 RepID=UPI0013B6337A|nr:MULTISPECIES: hypothetical protein [unclassified Moorena]NEN98196.1 hypothetical protein [Moorena sp. SIO3I7]NEO08065.1 hypothetical protein [Moorena sp. SIO3I8]NEQ83662.1 hypothetical protein [Moorena sp. SIO2I5]NET82926.1 hypothetical protein [Moorena sp. SIO1F2]
MATLREQLKAFGHATRTADALLEMLAGALTARGRYRKTSRDFQATVPAPP